MFQRKGYLVQRPEVLLCVFFLSDWFQKYKVQKKEIGPKVCIESGKKWGYGFSMVLLVLERTFALSKGN